MTTFRLVVIGGSAAGAKAAAKARRLNEAAEITMIEKGPDLSMAACGYPYYVGGEFDDRAKLLSSPGGDLRDPGFFAAKKNIKALNNTEVLRINCKEKSVTCRSGETGETTDIVYDKLVIATGAKPNRPPIPNIDLEGISTLLSMDDTDYLRSVRDEKKVEHAVVIGGGLIGMETCEALVLSGIKVTVVELMDQILPFLDWEMAKLVEKQLAKKGVEVITGKGVKEFVGEQGKVSGVMLDDGTVIDCGLAVVSMGVRPNSVLALEAGLDIGELGGIKVNEFMQTSDPDIYAAGDCVEIMNRSTGAAAFSPMGDLANIQGRIAGENIMEGNTSRYKGTFMTGICKIFHYNVGATGLSEKAAKKAGIDSFETVLNVGADKPHFMKAKLLISKLLVDKKDQRIIGFQCIGSGDVGREVGMAAMAIQGRLTIDELVQSDLPYAPPFSPALDHLIVSAHIMDNKLKGRTQSISPKELCDRLEKGDQPVVVDVREQKEFDKQRLNIGETLIPVGEVRNRIDELPDNKEQEIICFCKVGLRGYEASQAMRMNGYSNVRLLEGGMVAWPYEAKK